MNPAEIVKLVVSEKYVQDRFASLDWSGYEKNPDVFEKNYEVAKRKDSVTVKIAGGYNRFSENEKNEIVEFLKNKFSNVESVLEVEFMVSENYAGTKYDWLKIKLASRK